MAQSEVLSRSSATTEQLLHKILHTLEKSTMEYRDENHVRTRFWTSYKNEAKEYDDEFLRKRNGDLDIVLIFSGLFSAVSTAFISGMQSDLSPDPNDETQALLRILVHTLNNSAFTTQSTDLPVWNGPNSTVVWVQSLLYASLMASLLAALGAMLGKQWLSDYAGIRRTGSIDARGRSRQRKTIAFEAWHFDAVMESLPLLLQMSLMLFGIGLSAFIWSLQHTISIVLIAATSFGIVFYVFIVLSSLAYPDCPFQTPISKFLRLVFGIIDRSARYARQDVDFHHSTRLYRLALTRGIIIIILSLRHIIVYTLQSLSRLTISVTEFSTRIVQFIFLRKTGGLAPWMGQSLDAIAVAWTLEASTDLGIITAAAHMVPEIEQWPVEINVLAALVQILDTFADCFDQSQHGRTQLVAAAEDRALISGKALLHLYFARPFIPTVDNRWPFNHPVDGRGYQKLFHPGDHTSNDFRQLLENFRPPDVDLKFICDILRRTFYSWSESSNDPLADRHNGWTLSDVSRVSDSLLHWFSHAMIHCLSNPQLREAMKPKDAAVNVILTLLPRQYLPKQILANCLLAAGLLMGQSMQEAPLIRSNNDHEIEMILLSVFDQLVKVMPIAPPGSGQNSSDAKRESYALKLLEPLMQLLVAKPHFHYVIHSIRFLRIPSNIRLDERRQAHLFKKLNFQASGFEYSASALRLKVLMACPASIKSRYQWYMEYGPYGRPAGNNDHSISRDINSHTRGILDPSSLESLRLSEKVLEIVTISRHTRSSNALAIADGLLILYDILDLSTPSATDFRARLFDVISWGMRHPASRVCHSALKLAHRLRPWLEDPLPWTDILQAKHFCQNFCASLFLSTTTKHATDMPDVHVLDGSIDYDRDIRYLDIVCSLAQANQWHEALDSHGHIRRCIDIAKKLCKIYAGDGRDTTPIYPELYEGSNHLGSYKGDLWSRLIYILVSPSMAGLRQKSISPLNVDEELTWTFVLEAWRAQGVYDLEDIFISPMVQYTVEIISSHPHRATASLYEDIVAARDAMALHFIDQDVIALFGPLVEQLKQRDGANGDATNSGDL